MRTEYCAGGIILKKEKEKKFILLTIYDPAKYKDSHGYPKGRVEQSETLEEAAKREIIEETGLYDFEIKEKLGEIKRFAIRKEDGEKVFKIITLFRVEVNNYDMKEEKDELISWVDIKDVLKKLSLPEDIEFAMGLDLDKLI